jgi:hypothetical protein
MEKQVKWGERMMKDPKKGEGRTPFGIRPWNVRERPT